MEQSSETPATSLAEMIIEVLVRQTPEKTRQSVNACVQHVVNTVEVEKSKIIKQTGQKPIIQEKINPVTKHVMVPRSQFTGKVMDIPVVAQRQISMETVQKSIETPQLQYCDEVVDIPVQLVEQVSHVHVVAKTPEIPQLQVTDKVIDVPVVSAMQVPRVCAVKKTVEDSQFETVENPETQISDVVTDACLTCDAKCKVACETCVKDNMFMVAGEITVAGKMDDLNSVVAPRAAAQHRSIQSPQQRNHDKPEQQIEQAMQERERRQREKGEKGRERRT